MGESCHEVLLLSAYYLSLMNSHLSYSPFFEVKLVTKKEIVLLGFVCAWIQLGPFFFGAKELL